MTSYHIQLCSGVQYQELLPQNSHAKKYAHVYEQVAFREKLKPTISTAKHLGSCKSSQTSFILRRQRDRNKINLKDEQ
jgi:hypothetical protein